MTEEKYTEEGMQEALAKMEQMRGDMSSLMEQEKMLQNMMEDISAAEDTLERMKGVSEAEDILVPIGGSIYLKAKTIPGEAVLTDVGSGIHMEKGQEDASDIIEERKRDIEEGLEEVTKAAKELESNYRDIALYAQNAYQTLQGQG